MKTTQRLFHLQDNFLTQVKTGWFQGSHPEVSKANFEQQAQQWFLSSKLCHIVGADEFTCTDTILGCTHYIDSLMIKHQGCVQVLPYEYAYYRFLGISSTPVGQLRPGVPLIISMPNWFYTDVRPDWPDVLHECEAKNIDIHIDMAWITVCRDITIDVTHPQIKSFAMSLSKLNMEWNRIGLRWCRQRTSDSVTVFNHYQGQANAAAVSCGSYIMQQVPRDYAWNTHGPAHFAVCKNLGIKPSKAIHVAQGYQGPEGIANLLLDVTTPVSV
jgi:hypothetical protein